MVVNKFVVWKDMKIIIDMLMEFWDKIYYMGIGR